MFVASCMVNVHRGSQTGSRKRLHRRRQMAMAVIVLASSAALVGIGVTAWALRNTTPTEAPADAAAYGDGVEADVVAAAAVSHPIYRYSVVSGGVHNAREVVRAINDDNVVAEHYRTIALEHVRRDSLPEARDAYVSYRIGDRIFWTKRPVSLPAGEPILTDGVAEIRERCGNRISYEPQLPISDEEPDSVEFDALAPAAPRDLPARAGIASSPTSVPTGTGSSFPGLTDSGRFFPTGIGTPGGTNAPFLIGGPAVSSAVPDDGSSDSDDQNLVVVIPLPNGGGGDGSPGDNGNPPAPNPDEPKADGSTPGDSKTGDPLRDEGDTKIVILTPPGSTPNDLIPPTTTVGNEPGNAGPQNPPNQPTPVPEPGTMLLVGTGAAGALWRRVRSRRQR
jgi:hypothetical protein